MKKALNYTIRDTNRVSAATLPTAPSHKVRIELLEERREFDAKRIAALTTLVEELYLRMGEDMPPVEGL